MSTVGENHDDARVRIIEQTVDQLRHAFTAAGIIAWFDRVHPMLGQRPIDLLDDPKSYPILLDVATAARG